MLFFLVSFLSFLVLSKSLSVDPLPSWVNEMRVLSLLFGQELLYFLVHWLKQTRRITSAVLRIPPIMSAKKKVAPLVVDIEEESSEMSVLDLPELTLECILGKLSPAGLCNMAAVCSSLRESCRSDHLWERHMKEKWGRLIGPAARREWEAYVSSRKNHLASPSGGSKQTKWLESLSCMWPLSWLRSTADDGGCPRSSVPVGSTMSWYLALESGRFWFPAQVFNRENGHVGFMLSCYDAELSYDCRTDTFLARYPPHGRRIMVTEEGVQWDRLRAPSIDAPAHDLHASDCLNDLHPGDHIEIQWRRSKEFPYGEL
ncbi:hypothetical protein Taro_024297 [Colocasia esculenta]|uniref:F-box domain-containing protein n=1 Tax=Colocasia esculenta TaxID=4460 RepID=A0A843VE28_COLES|nr:hypothetical protein [Colocasia esculenta]